MTVPPNNNDIGAPFSQEAEEATIGSVLIDPSQFLILRAFLKASDFFLLRHQYIWTAMNDLDNQNIPIDIITLADRLEAKQVLENIGGRAYIVHLLNNTGTSVYAEVYGRLVEKTSIRRQSMIAADELKKQMADESANSDDILVQHASKIMDLQIRGDGMEFISIADAVSAHMDKFEQRRQNPQHVTGIPTTYRLFDYITQGLQGGRLYVVGGITGMGKSAFMLNICLKVAEQRKETSKDTYHIAWFSYENMVGETTTRMVANLATIDTNQINSATTSDRDTQLYFDKQGELANLNIELNENADLNVTGIRAMCRKLKYAGRLDAVFVDYLQIIPSGMKFNNRHEEIGYLSGELKKMAKELNIPIMTAAQLNRDSFKVSRAPKLSDLRESGKIEQDSDVVILLHSDDYPFNNDWDNVKLDWNMQVIVAKNRDGNTGNCGMIFRRPYMQFNEVIKDDSEDNQPPTRQHYADNL